MPNSYPFTLYSGILEPEHYKKIGSAIWLFLWFVSSTTKEVERDGLTWGIVLGNKPLKLKEMADVFGVNEKTVRRWLDDLEKNEYIKITRAPYGLIITVKNSKKYKNNRMDKYVHSQTERTKMSEPEWTEMSNHLDKNVHSNKDITKIYINTTTDTKDDIDLIADSFAALRTIQEGKIIHPNSKDYEAIAQIVAQGVPISRTIELLEQCFKEYGERNPAGKISSFNYCKKYISDKYQADLAREEAKKKAKDGAGNVYPINRRSNGSSKGESKPEPIFGDYVGRLPRKKV